MAYFGRNDITLTVQVPFLCDNECGFCNIKDLYKGINLDPKESLVNIKKTVKEVIDKTYGVTGICFSGGEPFISKESIDWLKEMIDFVVSEHWNRRGNTKFNIYINTHLPLNTGMAVQDFVENYNSVIRGISISRHTKDEKDDNFIFNNKVCSDKFITDLAIEYPKRFRINCVCNYIGSAIFAYNRWSGYDKAINKGYLKLNLREDYTKTTANDLHTLTIDQVKKYYFLEPKNEGGCNVCNAFSTKFDFVTIHKGLEYTHLKTEEYETEINDLIVIPDGTLLYEWDLRGDFDHLITPLEEVALMSEKFYEDQIKSHMDGSSNFYFPRHKKLTI